MVGCAISQLGYCSCWCGAQFVGVWWIYNFKKHIRNISRLFIHLCSDLHVRTHFWKWINCQKVIWTFVLMKYLWCLSGLEIVIQLLIDQGVSSLGHRYICLGTYARVGVSIKPHKSYGTNCVLDFGYGAIWLPSF